MFYFNPFVPYFVQHKTCVFRTFTNISWMFFLRKSLRKIAYFHQVFWCGNFEERQFPHSFGRFAQNCGTVSKTVFLQNFHNRKLDGITAFYALNSSPLKAVNYFP